MISRFSNPEFLRNVRSQLRPKKMLVVAFICAVLSLSTAYGFLHNTPEAIRDTEARNLLEFTLYAQALVLGAGGSIACLNNIFKEKERNSFDFQRSTRLTSVELTLGKLLGTPVFMYFVCACLMPLSLVAATLAHTGLSFFVAAYVVMLVSSLALHSLALLLSVLSIRGSQTGGIILILIALWISAYRGNFYPGYAFHLGALGPFFAPQLVEQTAWSPGALERKLAFGDYSYYESHGMVDVFFGVHVNHVPVTLIVDSILMFWFLLAVIRNIKRDPAEYELYSPWQFIGLTIFLNVVLVAFFNWRWAPRYGPSIYLLTLNSGIFLLLGLALLRNRERMRAIVRRRSQGPSWIDLCWPSPLLFAAAIMVATLIIISTVLAGTLPRSSLGLFVFIVFFAILWLVRDLQFLQWACLRRGKNSLVMGVLYLAIFYICTSTVFTALGLFEPDSASLTAFLFPTPLYYLNPYTWAQRPAIWTAAFLFQFLVIGVLFHLQKQQLTDLAGDATATAEPQPSS